MLLVRSRSNYRVQALPNIKADRSWNLSRIASVHISFSSSLHTLRYVLASSLSLTPLSIIALFFFSLSFPFLSFSFFCRLLFEMKWWPIKDSPWNKNFVDWYFWYWRSCIVIAWKKFQFPKWIIILCCVNDAAW